MSNIIPATTGAADALSKVIPSLQGKINGQAMRVPVSDVSLVDLVVELERPCLPDSFKNAIQEAAESQAMSGILDYTTDQPVSSDFIGHKSTCIVDFNACQFLNPNFIKVICWYDNEAAYSAKLLDFCIYMVEKDLNLADSKDSSMAF